MAGLTKAQRAAKAAEAVTVEAAADPLDVVDTEVAAEVVEPSAVQPEKAPEVAQVKTVRMVRESLTGPTEADVHPDEVANYSAFDWRVA